MALRQREMLEALDYTIRIGSPPTFLYFDLYIIKSSLKTLRYQGLMALDEAQSKGPY